MTSWFRSWHGAPTDNKWLMIANRAGVPAGIVSATVWAMLDYASQNDARGSIEGFDVETYAAYSGFTEEQIEAVIKALKDKGLIENNCFKSWDKRQPKKEDDGAVDRKRKQREREMSRHVTPCHAPETEADTDTDSDFTTETTRVVDVGKKIAEIVGWSNDPNWFGDYSRIEVWLKKGWDIERDIVPTVQKLMHKKTGDPPKTLKYFEAAIADAYATRTKPLPEGTPRAGKKKSVLEQAGEMLENGW